MSKSKVEDGRCFAEFLFSDQRQTIPFHEVAPAINKLFGDKTIWLPTTIESYIRIYSASLLVCLAFNSKRKIVGIGFLVLVPQIRGIRIQIRDVYISHNGHKREEILRTLLVRLLKKAEELKVSLPYVQEILHITLDRSLLAFINRRDSTSRKFTKIYTYGVKFFQERP